MTTVESLTAFAAGKVQPVDDKGKGKICLYIGFTFTIHRVAYVSVLVLAILLWLAGTQSQTMSCTAAGGVFTETQTAEHCKSRRLFIRYGPTTMQMESVLGRRFKTYEEVFNGYSQEDVVNYWGLYPQLILVVLSGLVYMGRVAWDLGLSYKFRLLMSNIHDTNLPTAEKQDQLTEEAKDLAKNTPLIFWYCMTQFTALASPYPACLDHEICL